MKNFEYFAPTKVVFGRGTENTVGDLVRNEGGKKVLLVYGGGSAVRSGLISRVFASLDSSGIAHISLGGVVPNPRLSLVRRGIAVAKEENVNFLLAIGGGSVIDTVKAIGYGLANPENDVWDFYTKKAKPHACAPLGCVLTIAASGSEMSNSSVITNEIGNLKRSCNTDYARPRFAVMNPELTYTLPPYQTAAGCTDIMMHTMERYFMKEPTLDITDGMAEALLRNMLVYTPAALRKPDDYKARAEIMWCGSLSHNGLMNCGGTRGDFSCHQLEHELGGKYDVAHGAGLAAIWASWARYVYKEDVPRFVRFAEYVMGVPVDGTDEIIALRGIAAFEHFLKSIGMPISLAQLGIHPTEEDLHELAWKCTFENTRRIGTDGILPLGLEDIVQIYRNAMYAPGEEPDDEDGEQPSPESGPEGGEKTE